MDTEDRLERYRDADTWPAERSLAAMLDSQMAAFDAVRNALPALARAAEAAAERLGRGGRLVYAGAGASGRLAVQDGVELHPTFGWPRARPSPRSTAEASGSLGRPPLPAPRG